METQTGGARERRTKGRVQKESRGAEKFSRTTPAAKRTTPITSPQDYRQGGPAGSSPHPDAGGPLRMFEAPVSTTGDIERTLLSRQGLQQGKIRSWIIETPRNNESSPGSRPDRRSSSSLGRRWRSFTRSTRTMTP